MSQENEMPEWRIKLYQYINELTGNKFKPGDVFTYPPEIEHAFHAGFKVGRASAQQWRTMDSAPKDGTPFWGKVNDDAIKIFWHDKFKEFVSGFRRMFLHDGSTFSDTGLPYDDHSPEIRKPVAWMPLPPPPTEMQGETNEHV